MKFSIMGFSQSKALELGLESNDLLVLRWFVDFAGTSKMKTMLIDNKIYYWIDYKSVLEDLPILKISKQTLYKKHFVNLVLAKVLERKQIKEGGNFSYYCYGINYQTLIQTDKDTSCVQDNNLMSKNTQGYVQDNKSLVSNSTEPLCQDLPNIDNSITNTSIKNILKEKYKRENPEVFEIIDFWNERSIDDRCEGGKCSVTAIKKALSKYTADEIKTAIDRYKQVINDQSYYYNYSWKIELFLTRKGGITEFFDGGNKWQNYLAEKNRKTTRKPTTEYDVYDEF